MNSTMNLQIASVVSVITALVLFAAWALVQAVMSPGESLGGWIERVTLSNL